MIRQVLIYSLLTIVGVLTLNAQNSGKGTIEENFAIYYKHDSISINPNYLSNRKQIDHIVNYLRHSPRIDSITIYAWASPEGGYQHNVWLSQERAKAAKRFLLRHAADSSKLNSEKIKISPLAENWPGLIKRVEENYFRHDRDKVLEILYAGDIGDETRKWRLKQLDKGYTWTYLIRRYMPELRAATWGCVWAEVLDPLPSLEAPLETASAPPSPPLPVPPVTVDRWKTILGLKTNLLYDAATALNFAIEVPFNEHLSVQYEHHCPWWLSRNNINCLQFLSFGAEARWWFAPRLRLAEPDLKQRDALVGHFLGLYGWTGYSDIQVGRDFGCYQFEFCSAGLTYGFATPIGKYLNFEFSMSAGYAQIPYRHYIPSEDWQLLIRDRNDAGVLHYFGPTKVEFSIAIPIRIKMGGGSR